MRQYKMDSSDKRSSWDGTRVIVLVGTDTGSFESLRGQLLVLVGDHVHAQRELVNVGLLTTQIEDTDLGVGDTTVEPGLRVGLIHHLQSAPDPSKFIKIETISHPPSTLPSLVISSRMLVRDAPPQPRRVTRGKRQKWQKIKIPFISFSLDAPCSCSSGNISRDGGPWCLLEMGDCTSCERWELSIRWLSRGKRRGTGSFEVTPGLISKQIR